MTIINFDQDLRVKATSEAKSESCKKEGADKEGEVEPGEGEVGSNHPGGEGGRQQEAEQDQDVAGPSQGLCPCVHLSGDWTAAGVIGADNGSDQDVEGKEQDQGERNQHGCGGGGGKIQPTGFLRVGNEVGVEDGESDPRVDARQNSAHC